jgi:GNAT superfamily N-acetyltransferase
VPPLPVTTRVARAADAETMSRSLRLGFDTYRSFAPAAWSPPVFAGELEFAREKLRSRHTWALLADIAGEPAGHVAMFPDATRDDTAYLWQLFVRPPWWGTGLARRLHQLALEEAARQGYETIRLYTPHGAARARAFYEREGWELASSAFAEPLLGLNLVEYRRGL